MGVTQHTRCVERGRDPIITLVKGDLLLLTFQTARRILRFTVGWWSDQTKQKSYLLLKDQMRASGNGSMAKGIWSPAGMAEGLLSKTSVLTIWSTPRRWWPSPAIFVKQKRWRLEIIFSKFLLFLNYLGSLYKHLLSPRVLLQAQQKSISNDISRAWWWYDPDQPPQPSVYSVVTNFSLILL